MIDASVSEATAIAAGIRTFLIADIRDYTRFCIDHGDEAAARLATRFAELVEDEISARGGEVVELRGDEALAVFSSARQALRAAVELQDRLAQATSESLPLRVGMGLDAGEAVPVKQGYRGTAVNLAARLCALAGSGEVLISETLAALVRKVEGLIYVDRGPIALKGFMEPMRVIQVLAATAPEAGASTARATTSFHVQLLGPFRLTRDRTSIDVRGWQRRVAALFKLLAIAPGRRRLQDDVIDLLWPDAPPDVGAGNLRTLVHRLRRALGTLEPSPILSDRGWIALNPSYTWDIDLEQFEARTREAGDKPVLLEEAAALYDGEPLEDERYEDWAAPVRKQVQRRWRELCLRLADLHEAGNAHKEAARWLERLLEADPLDEEAVQRLLIVLLAGDQRTSAVRVYQQFEQRLREEIDLPPEPGTLAIMEGVKGRRREGTSEADSAVVPPHNLPIQATPFIGRTVDVAAVSELVQHDEVRLLTLTGAGGSGKTRLALQAAGDVLGAFKDGVFVISLASLPDSHLVMEAIARTLGLKEDAGQSVAKVVTTYLREKEMLLVLDNFEHLLEAAPLMGDLLASSRRLKVLVTSRTALRLSAEYLYDVAPLLTPSLEHLPAVEALSRYDAVSLFVQRAAAVAPSFNLTTDNARAIVEICQHLDGLPLAIELAAARMRLFPAPALLQRLREGHGGASLRLLVGGPRDLPERHQTLYRTIDWSDQLLDASQRKLFARLAVFAGGCTIEAAEAVCTGEGGSDMDVLEGVTSLIDHSLLGRTVGSSPEPRLVMLQTVQAYAQERLAASGEAARIRRQHASYYASLAEEAERQFEGPDAAAWLDRLEEEHDNLRAALQWAHESGEVEIGLRVAAAAWRFWVSRAYATEGRDWMDKLLAGTGSGASAQLASLRARAFHGAGWLAWSLGEESQRLFERSLALARDAGDRTVTGETLCALSRVAHIEGDFVRAAALAQESLALARELGSTRQIANSLCHLALGVGGQGDYTRGVELLHEALILFRQLRDTGGIAFTLFWGGELACQQGDYTHAAASYEECLALTRERGDKDSVTWQLLGLAEALYGQGDIARAIALCQESLALWQDMGREGGAAPSLRNLALAACRQGDLQQATGLLEESLAVERDVDTWFAGEVKGSLALLAHAQGHERQARRFLAEIPAMDKSGSDAGLFIGALAGMAGIAAALGQPEPAAWLLGAAQELRARTVTTIPYGHHAFLQRQAAATRMELGEERFAEAWHHGRTMTFAQAVDHVLGAGAIT